MHRGPSTLKKLSQSEAFSLMRLSMIVVRTPSKASCTIVDIYLWRLSAILSAFIYQRHLLPRDHLEILVSAPPGEPGCFWARSVNTVPPSGGYMKAAPSLSRQLGMYESYDSLVFSRYLGKRPLRLLVRYSRTKGPQLKIGTADQAPRKTLEERLEETPSNARCFAQGSSLMC